MIKKLILLLMVGLLASCGTSVIVEEELPQVEVIEPEIVVPEVVEELPEDEDVVEDIIEEVPVIKEREIPVGAALPEVCQVPHDNRLRNDYWEMVMGFPRPANRLPNNRNIKALVIFVEFPEYPASRSIEQLNSFFENRYVKMTNDYIGAMSYGRVQHEFYYHDQIIMAELPRTSGPLPVGEDYVSEFVRKTLPLADEQIDFSPYDYVIFHVDPTLPLSIANFAWANMARPNRGYVTQEKTFFNMNAWSGETVRPQHEWVGLHEILHLYGLADYYSRQNGVWLGHAHVGTFDIMSHALGINKELLLWSRWFIGWVTPEDIHCFDGRTTIEPTEVMLNGTMNLEGTKGILIRVNEYELILIERKERSIYCGSCNGGLIVTRYNASLAAMNGPLQIVRPIGSTDPDYQDAFIYKGDFIDVAGVRIDVLEYTTRETVIRVTRP